MKLVEWAAAGREDLVIAVAQRSEAVEDPSVSDLCTIGTAARIVKIIRLGPATYSAVLDGLARVRVRARPDGAEFLSARYEVIAADLDGGGELFVRLIEVARRSLEGLPRGGGPQPIQLEQCRTLGDLTDVVAAQLHYASDTRFRQGLLETEDPVKRAHAILAWFHAGGGIRSADSSSG